MIGLGFWEIVIILLIVIVFVRPKDLPKVARKIGNLYHQMRRLSDQFSDQVRDFENEDE